MQQHDHLDFAADTEHAPHPLCPAMAQLGNVQEPNKSLPHIDKSSKALTRPDCALQQIAKLSQAQPGWMNKHGWMVVLAFGACHGPHPAN